MPDLIFYSIVFIVCLFASLIDVIAGGGVMIVIPSLTLLGIPIYVVVGTNLLYNFTYMIVAAASYLRQKVRVDWKLVALLILPRAIGSALGASSLLQIPKETARTVIGVLILFAIAAIILLDFATKKRTAGLKNASAASRPRRDNTKLAMVFILIFFIGMLEGFGGAGGGAVTRFILIFVLGYTLLEAAVADVLISIVSSLAGALIFSVHGSIDYTLLIPMVLGGIIGALIGTTLAVRKGDGWARQLLFAVVLALIIKMLFFP